MTQNIENGFSPETVNELLLLNRIGELRRALYQRGTWEVHDPNAERVNTAYPMPPQLHMAGLVTAEDEGGFRGLKIMARSFGRAKETQIGFAQYVSRDVLTAMQPGGAAHMLGTLHREALHLLAKHIEEGGAYALAA